MTVRSSSNLFAQAAATSHIAAVKIVPPGPLQLGNRHARNGQALLVSINLHGLAIQYAAFK